MKLFKMKNETKDNDKEFVKYVKEQTNDEEFT